MMRKIFLVLILVLLPAISWADEYILVMSKEDNVCQHMMKIYNSDLKKYGKVKYEKHKEFNWIKWEGKVFRLRPVGELPSYKPIIENAQVAVFDINNDSKNEAIIYTQAMLSSNLTDYYDIFPAEILEMLDKNEVVEGDLYFPKRLKLLNSNDGIPVNIYDLSEEDIKKLPQETQINIEGRKKMGRQVKHFIGGGHKINFLKFKNHFYIVFEGPRSTVGPNESYKEVEHYSIISELQKDNTLKNQCLYLINKDKSTKGRTK